MAPVPEYPGVSWSTVLLPEGTRSARFNCKEVVGDVAGLKVGKKPNLLSGG